MNPSSTACVRSAAAPRFGNGRFETRSWRFARLVVLPAFALIVGDAVVTLWQRGDYFMRRYFQARAGARPGKWHPSGRPALVLG